MQTYIMCVPFRSKTTCFCKWTANQTLSHGARSAGLANLCPISYEFHFQLSSLPSSVYQYWVWLFCCYINLGLGVIAHKTDKKELEGNIKLTKRSPFDAPSYLFEKLMQPKYIHFLSHCIGMSFRLSHTGL